MLSQTWRKTLWSVIVGIAFAFFAFGQTETKVAHLDKTDFVAQGINETLLHINSTGRYSLQAKSDQGTEIKIVDRMAGPFAASGKAGEQDGRLDILLDQATYKVRLKSHEKGKGSLKLEIYPFQEVQEVDASGELPLLGAYRVQSGSLADLQQRSFWIYLEKRQILRLEAIGRNLKDCRLWCDRAWLVDATPRLSTYEATNGQPMTYAEFHHDLNPGLYLLTCYGGKALAWADDSGGASPFFLRLGIPELGTNGKQILTISPFGRDTFLLPEETDFFQLLREDKKETVLRVKGWRKGESRHGDGLSASVTKESRNPWAIVQWNRGRQKKWVTVQGKPGDGVVLEYFVRHGEKYTFTADHQAYWISSQHSAAGRDAIDVTAILTYPPQNAPVTSQVFHVGRDIPLVRKINLLGKNSVFLKVAEAGTYVIGEGEESGARGRYQIEPFMVSRPRNYQSPPFQPPFEDIELTTGFFTLTIQPDSKGILSFALRLKVENGQSKTGETGGVDFQTDEVFPVTQSVLWPNVSFPQRRERYTLWLNHRHDVASGLIIRPLPVDLSEPLPVTLNPGASAPINIVVRKKSKLVIERDRETPFLLTEGQATLSSNSLLSIGKYGLNLKNTGEKTTLFTLKTIPDAGPQRLTFQDIRARLGDRPLEFPLLTEKKPLYVGFDRGEKKHFTLLVEEPGLYRLETSGRMASRLTVRTAIVTSLFGANQNGIGRNALVQQYLRPGKYQITAQTQGRSKGRAGIHLHRTSLIAKNFPKVDDMDKGSLEPNAAVRYRFVIDEAGKYRLQTYGLGKQFAHRLEDKAGWSLLRPGGKTEIIRHFEPGIYHYYSLPLPVESKRITALSRIIEKQELTGKGPHRLGFNETLQHLWREEPGRPADIFTTEITAPVEVKIHLSREMEAAIHRDSQGEVGRITGGKAWEGKLSPGRYEIQVKGIEANDQFPYTLRLSTQQLIPGLRQQVTLPAFLAVSLGKAGLVDIYSFGATDVKASLWDEAGRHLLAQHDDMADDWNFRISRKLEAGRYLLKLIAVGSTYGPVEVAMSTREERFIPERGLPPFTVTENLEGEVLRVPFRTDEANPLLWVKATGDGPLGLALLRDGQVLVDGREAFYIPVRTDTSYSLLLWQLGEPAGKVILEVTSLKAQKLPLSPGENKLMRTPSTASTAMELINGDKGSYWLKGNAGPYFFSSTLEQPLHMVNDAPVVMNSGGGWLIVKASEATKYIIIKPFTLDAEEVEVLELGQVPFPFDFQQEVDGPLTLEVESVGSIIGAMAYSRERSVAGEFHWSGMSMEPSSTLVAVPGKGKYRGKIWQTRKISQKEKVRLRTHIFKSEGQVDWGGALSHEGALEPGMARTILLHNAPQTLELTLTRGLVAFVWHKDHAEAIVAARNENIQQEVSASGGSLTVLNRAREKGIFRIERKGKSSQTIQDFNKSSGFEHVFREAGTLSLHISGVREGRQIFVAGDQVTSRFLGSDGHISEGDNYVMSSKPQSDGGILELSHGPGYVKVWQAGPENKRLNFIGQMPKGGAKRLQNGIGDLKDKTQLWEFVLENPAYITVAAEAPGATALLAEQKILTIRVGSGTKGRQLDYFLLPGTYQLWTRPLSGLRQQGEFRMYKVFPQPLDEEAEEPKTWLIRPGETQVFTFHVAVEGKVGVGVRTESDQLEAKLFSSKFDLLASGPLMVQTLEPGEYLLTVETSPLASAPIQYSPVVVGHKGSEQGVPEDVIRGYVTQKATNE